MGLGVYTLLPACTAKKALTFYQSPGSRLTPPRSGKLAYYRAMCRKGVLREIPDKATLKSHYDLWQTAIAKKPSEPRHLANDPALGFILSMEGASPDPVPRTGPAVVRVGPADRRPDPLRPQRILPRHRQPGAAHRGRPQAPPARWTASGCSSTRPTWPTSRSGKRLDIYHGPVLASHHNCRSLVPGDRQLTDEQIKALIARGA